MPSGRGSMIVMASVAHTFCGEGQLNLEGTFEGVSLRYAGSERGSIVVRAHASRAKGLWFEPDSMP